MQRYTAPSRLSSSARGSVVPLLGVAAALLCATSARAEQPPGDGAPVVEPHLSISASIGGAMGIHHVSVNQLKLGEELGYRLGDGPGGLVLGVGLGESFGDGLTVIQVGARVAYAIPVSAGAIDLEIVPGGSAGFAHLSVDAGAFGNASDTVLDVQGTVDLRVGLSGGWFLVARPVGLDLLFDDSGTAVRWDLMVGGGIRI